MRWVTNDRCVYNHICLSYKVILCEGGWRMLRSMKVRDEKKPDCPECLKELSIGALVKELLK